MRKDCTQTFPFDFPETVFRQSPEAGSIRIRRWIIVSKKIFVFFGEGVPRRARSEADGGRVAFLSAGSEFRNGV